MPGVERRPKVLHVSTSDMSLGVLLLNQLRHIRDAGYEVMGVSSAGPYLARVEEAGIRTAVVPMVRAITPGADAVALARLVRVFRRERPAIVHTHTPKAALLGQYAALLARVPVRVHTIHGLYFPGHMTPRTRPFYVAAERLTMRFTHLALSQNPEDIPVSIEEKICRPDRVQYLGNGIDLDRFRPERADRCAVERLRTELGMEPGDPVVGIVARVNREKGYLEFFQAARKIAERVPRARFVVVGPVESEKFDALDPVQLAREAGVAERTHYLGVRSDMLELYTLFDVLVLPSHREGFPRSPMEAHAMGRPAVATDIRGCRQVVADGETGFLVPLRDPEALADRVARVLEDPALARRMGEAALARAREHFDERKVIERTLAAYDELLKRRAA